MTKSDRFEVLKVYTVHYTDVRICYFCTAHIIRYFELKFCTFADLNNIVHILIEFLNSLKLLNSIFDVFKK
jgi:hypothetical protein